MSFTKNITVDPQVMGGKPCIRGTRVTVATVLGFLGEGYTSEQILEIYPYITGDDIHACSAFAAWRMEESEKELKIA